MSKVHIGDVVYVSYDGNPANVTCGTVINRSGRGRITVKTWMNTITATPTRHPETGMKQWACPGRAITVYPLELLRRVAPHRTNETPVPYRVENRNRRIYYVMAKNDEHAAMIAEMKGVVQKRQNASVFRLCSVEELPRKYKKNLTCHDRTNGGMLHAD